MECESFEKEYTGNFDKWKVAAISEYSTNRKILDKGSDSIYDGPLQCFCEH